MLRLSEGRTHQPREPQRAFRGPGASGFERLLLCLLLAVQAAMLSWIDWRTAPTWDEWGHLPSGLYHVQFSEFEPYCVNPPLVRMVAALPVLAAGGGMRWLGHPSTPGLRSESALGVKYLEDNGERCFQLFSLARMALIPVSLLGTFLLWSIARRFYGAASGWVAAVLWSFSPMALGFGGTIAPDVSAAVLGLLAAYRFYIWLQLGTWRSAIFLGIATALALLCKSAWLILPPVFAILWLCDRIKYARRPLKTDFAQCAVGFAVAMLLIHAAYSFHGALRPLDTFEFRSQTLTGKNIVPGVVGNRFYGSWLGRIPVPLPADYVYGIDIQRVDFEAGLPSYLLGKWRNGGFWNYYLVGIPLKEPVALWGLILVLATGFLLHVQRRVRWRELVILAPGVAELIFVCTQTGFSHHVRYALPFFPCLYLVASRSVAVNSRWPKILVPALCCWYAVSSASILPRSYAFFSEAVGGAAQGWRYLGDSNLDWGQDLTTLRDWAKANPDKRPIWLLYSPEWVDFDRLGIDATDGYPRVIHGRPSVAGWWAVFATPMIEPQHKWFLDHPATIQLSPTLKLIEVPETDLDLSAPVSDSRRDGTS